MDASTEPSLGEVPARGASADCHESPPVTGTCVSLRLVLKPSGPVLELNRPDLVVGRHSTADVRLTLPDVSRRHCRFVYSEASWHVFDLDSLNGIFVNGERVRQATLHDRDIMGIGGFMFEVELNRDSSSSDLPALEAEQPIDGVLRDIVEAVPHQTQRVIPQQRKAS